MLKSEQIPTEVRAVFEKACDSGEPWNIADTIAAAINAWPGMERLAPHDSAVFNDGAIILPLPQEKPDEITST